MEWVRSGGSGPDQKYPKEASNVHTEKPQTQARESSGGLLSSMETPSRTVYLGSVNTKLIPMENRFSVLTDDDLEEEELGSPSEQEFPPLPSSTRREVVPKKRWGPKFIKLNSLERREPQSVHHVGSDDFMEITVDSGAAENMMPPDMAPSTPLLTSQEQAAGVLYSAANGDLMPNRGMKNVDILTGEGQARKLKMQVTDVNRALMSVAKVCDAGHTVTFTKNGGVITILESGEETRFRRENNVYRLTVQLRSSTKDFPRQG